MRSVSTLALSNAFWDFLGVWEGSGYPDRALINPVEPTCQRNPIDPGIYLALVIITFFAVSVGVLHLRRRRLAPVEVAPRREALWDGWP